MKGISIMMVWRQRRCWEIGCTKGWFFTTIKQNAEVLYSLALVKVFYAVFTTIMIDTSKDINKYLIMSLFLYLVT